MKRRLTSAALCLFMLATAASFAACGQEDDLSGVGEEQIDSAMTLNIYGIKGEGTTDEAIAMVEEAMSSITEAQFNTAIKLMLYTEDEYDEVLEAKMDAIQEQLDLEAAEAEAKKEAEKAAKEDDTADGDESTDESTEEIVDETILDEYGLVETFYPEVEETQLDIFLMTDYDMLMKYSEKGVLSALDESLSSSSKLLKSYINPNILAAGKVNGSTVAILNNQMIGEYTFMLLNRELIDKYYYDPEDLLTFEDTFSFILDVGRNDSAYTPFVGDISPVGIHYFTSDGSQSIVGNLLAPDAVGGTNGAPKALTDVRNWTDYIEIVKQLEDEGYIGGTEIAVGDQFGVGIIKGEWSDVEGFEEDYYINVLQNPQATYDNIYNGMFAVSTYTKSLARSMEIVTYLNTRSDLRNLFAYGVQGVHYELDDNGVVVKLSDDYNMKLEYTGNSFVAYPPEGSYPEVWEDAKQHNLDMVLSPYYGFIYDETLLDPALVSAAADFSEDFFAELEDVTYAELEEWLDTISEEIDDNDDIQALIATTDEDTEDEYEPLGKIYADWFASAYPAT